VSYKVSLTQSALNDLYAINDYYLAQVSDKIAGNVINKIQASIQSLKDLPERGTIPTELSATGMTRYRQILSSVYRIIYRIEDKNIYIVMVIDGRRDVVTALTRRQFI